MSDSDLPEEEIIRTDEDTPEDIELEAVEASHQGKAKKLRDALKTCEDEKREYLEEAQRAKADFLNSKKRLEDEKQQAIIRATHQYLCDLLPLADSFAMARQNTDVWESIDETWRKGVEGIHAQLQSILQKHAVSSIDPLGEAFDPTEHEAVSSTESDKDPDTILEVVQVGYKQNDTIIRPAKVIISS